MGWQLLCSSLILWQIHVPLAHVANLRHHLIAQTVAAASPGDAHRSIPAVLLPSDTHAWPPLPSPC